MSSLFIHNARQLVSMEASPASSIGCIEDGAVHIEDGLIKWLGKTSDAPEALRSNKNIQQIDASQHVIMPGFIDCHTHLVFAGHREHEFKMRLQGKSYEEIAAQGGGILSSVKHTREASADELFTQTQKRLQRMLDFGITTVEIKSGYGLALDHEIKCLDVIRRLNESVAQDIVSTFLGAHEVPLEYRAKPQAYVDHVINDMIPEVAKGKLADFCDVFCERGVFDVAQSRAILEQGLKHGMLAKAHAEELCHLGGAEMAADLGAISADHLLHVSDQGIEAMAKSGTTAVLLPGTSLFLRCQEHAPARKLIEHGVPVAIGSDCNPGSCMSENLPLMGTLGCLNLGMLPEEILQGLTINAARALNLHETHGSLKVGKVADIIMLDIPNYEYLPYHFGVNHVDRIIKRGTYIAKH